MKWLKVLANKMYSKEEEELLDRFGSRGYFIDHRLQELMATRLDPDKKNWMEFDFDLLKFKQVFNPHARHVGLFNVLDLLKQQGDLKYFITQNGKRIVITSRKFELSAQEFVRRTRKLAGKELD